MLPYSMSSSARTSLGWRSRHYPRIVLSALGICQLCGQKGTFLLLEGELRNMWVYRRPKTLILRLTESERKSMIERIPSMSDQVCQDGIRTTNCRSAVSLTNVVDSTPRPSDISLTGGTRSCVQQMENETTRTLPGAH